MARRPKLPVPAPAAHLLDGFYEHFRVSECVAFTTMALERAKLTERDLAPYQADLLRDLHEPLDEEALGDMLAYWEYDIPRLVKRGRGYRSGVPAKPRIDLIVEITSKDNLKVEWFPQGWEPYSADPLANTDFVWWMRREHRHVAYDTRPSNELVFIHNIRTAIWSISRQETHRKTALLDHVLLSACKGAVTKLEARLEPHFDVRMVTDVFVEWEERELFHLGSRNETPPRILRWEIDSPDERRKAAELLELDELESRVGFSELVLIEVQDFENARVRPSGPAPSPHTLADRLTRELKKRGFPATRGKVERALKLVERHRKPSNVVPLRPA